MTPSLSPEMDDAELMEGEQKSNQIAKFIEAGDYQAVVSALDEVWPSAICVSLLNLSFLIIE